MGALPHGWPGLRRAALGLNGANLLVEESNPTAADAQVSVNGQPAMRKGERFFAVAPGTFN